MKYITILCKINKDLAITPNTTYWLANDSKCNKVGFATLERNRLNSYDLINFKSMELMSLSSDFKVDGDGQ